MADQPAAAPPKAGRKAGLVRDLPLRGRARGKGYVERITIYPRGGGPRFSAIVSDAADLRAPTPGQRHAGTARYRESRVKLVWMGQRKVPGIEAGTQLVFEGMVSSVDGLPTIYNPRYEIVGRPEAPR